MPLYPPITIRRLIRAISVSTSMGIFNHLPFVGGGLEIRSGVVWFSPMSGFGLKVPLQSSKTGKEAVPPIVQSCSECIAVQTLGRSLHCSINTEPRKRLISGGLLLLPCYSKLKAGPTSISSRAYRIASIRWLKSSMGVLILAPNLSSAHV